MFSVFLKIDNGVEIHNKLNQWKNLQSLSVADNFHFNTELDNYRSLNMFYPYHIYFFF